ncbi:MAG: hypothetical protein RL238_1916 [Actinomycetota bacterium]|jgi:hypothetical protein
MPSRRRPKSPSSTAPSAAPRPSGAPAAPATASGKDPAELFAAALKESEARDKVQREKDRQAKDAADRTKAEQRAHADALTAARRELDRAIQAVRDAKRDGRSTVEADARWKAAKAKVIELETGEAPAWAPPPPAEVAPDDADASPAEADESPVDDGAIGEEQA